MSDIAARIDAARRRDLIARIDAHRGHYSGAQHVPYSQRHTTPRPPMTGSPEKLADLLGDIRAYLEGELS